MKSVVRILFEYSNMQHIHIHNLKPIFSFISIQESIVYNGSDYIQAIDQILDKTIRTKNKVVILSTCIGLILNKLSEQILTWLVFGS